MLRNTTQSLIYILILATMAFVPIMFSQAFTQFSLPKLGVVVLGVFIATSLWLVSVMSGRWGRTRIGPLALPVSAFMGVAILSSLFSLDPVLSLLGKYRNPEGMITLLVYAGLFLVATQVIWTRERLINLLRTMAASGLLVTLYGLAQFIGADPVQWGSTPFDGSRIFSTFGNPSLLGGYLAATMLIGLGLSLAVKGRNESVMWGISSGLAAVALAFSQTRGAWISAAIGVLILGLVIWRFSRTETKGKPIARSTISFAATLILVLTAMSLLTGPETQRSGLTDITSRVEAGSLVSVSDRLEMWKSAARMAVDRPLLGQGLDTYRLRYEKFQTLEGAQIKGAGAVGEDAHNYVLQISATGGMMVLVAFLFLMTMMLMHGVRLAWVKSANPDSQDSVILATLLVASSAYMLSALFTINVVGGFIFFWLVAGIISSRAVSGPDKGLDSLRTSRDVPLSGIAWLASLATTIVVASIIVGDLRYQSATQEWDSALRSGSTTQLREATQGFEAAFKLNPWIDRYMADLSQKYLDLIDRTGDNSLLAAADEANRKGAETRPLDPWFSVNQGVIDGRTAHAQRSSRGADQFNQAELKLMASAESSFISAIDAGPHSAYAHYFYGFLLIDLQRWDEAVDQLTVAAGSDSGLPDISGAKDFARSNATSDR